MDDLWSKRPSAITAHPSRKLTKIHLARRVGLSKPAFNKYYRDVGARWPFPTEDHLVYLVGAHDGVLRYASPSLRTTLHLPEDAVGFRIGKALRGGEELAATAPEVLDIGRRLRDGGEDELEYSTYLVRWDDHARVPVSMLITYGLGFDVFFVDAMISGEVDLSYAQPEQLRLKQEDLGEDMFNVEPSVVYTVRRTLEPGSGKTGTFLELLGYKS
jgi:hypothetical protein